ncbi:MAG: sigma-70 family RNA polymerase sigma factor [Armatimonadetes bacterium]|nr:sigma-70 family RNA polymerase sigma factor [Armatimonadota bacterium]
MVARNALRLDLKVPLKSASMEARFERDSDEALVAEAREGDFSAFERLFERHRNLVYRFVYQMSNRRDDAEDLTQEVFVRAYQNLHRYRDEAKFTTWLLRIATNLATDRARMSQRRQALETQESGSQGALAWMTVGNVDDPVENLESDRRVAALRKALAALPEHHRNVIVLRDIEEMDYKDMAELLGCTVGGAKLRVLRARRALRDRVLSLMETEASA